MDMLSVVAAIAFSQLSTDHALAKKLTDAAEKSGWTVAVQGGSRKSSVNEILMRDGFTIRFQIDVEPSAAKARDSLKDMADEQMVSTLGARVPLDEPQLHGTGMKMSVLDYKNKRIRSMQTYALSNMRVTGVVNRSAVCVAAQQFNSHYVAYKTDTKIYDDLMRLIKIMVQELKKK